MKFYLSVLILLKITNGFEFIRSRSTLHANKIDSKTVLNTRHFFKLHLLQENNVSPTDAVSSRMDSKFSSSKLGLVFEEDINFCLRKCDTALSGISRSKVLNELTNNVMRALIIGYEPIIQELFLMFEKYREQVDKTECVFDDDDVLGNSDYDAENPTAYNQNSNEFDMVVPSTKRNNPNPTIPIRPVTAVARPVQSSKEKLELAEKICTVDLLTSRVYVDRLEKLLQTGKIQQSSLGGIYDRGYKRLLTILRDAECVFPRSPMLLPDESNTDKVVNYLGGSASKILVQRPKPVDQDICLSILDKMTPTSAITDVESVVEKTNSKTKILNALSNVVFRAVLYGRKQEKMMIIEDIGKKIPSFAAKWTKGDHNSQEIIYLRTLQLLLNQGLQAAENVITNKASGNLNLNKIINENTNVLSNKNGYSNEDKNNNTITSNVNFIGLYSNTAKNGEIDNINSINEIVSTRLYDTYQNAFYRVVECCFKEIGKRSNTVPQNKDVLLNIASWERNIRGEITSGNWIRNPTELVGVWTLSDIAGESDLTFDNNDNDSDNNNRGSSSDDNEDTLSENEQQFDVFTPWMRNFLKNDKSAVSIELGRDGKVNAQSEDFLGDIWQSTPGPAHLDTVEFTLKSKQNPEQALKYVGFIDRGQRIESRFSRNPIRMTGRVLSIEKGVMRGSNRFIMFLPRKGTFTAGTSSSSSEEGGSGSSSVYVGKINEIAPGERKVITTASGAVIVANIDGTYFAVNAKCPHLGLPMKKGPITIENGEPIITCNFHNSKFSLNDGSCKAWCTGALNIPNSEGIGEFMSNFGGDKNSPAIVYKVVNNEGNLFLEM